MAAPLPQSMREAAGWSLTVKKKSANPMVGDRIAERSGKTACRRAKACGCSLSIPENSL